MFVQRNVRVVALQKCIRAESYLGNDSALDREDGFAALVELPLIRGEFKCPRRYAKTK